MPIANPVQLSTRLADSTWYSPALMEHIAIYIHLEFAGETTQLISATMKGLMKAHMELEGCGTSKKIKYHWTKGIRQQEQRSM